MNSVRIMIGIRYFQYKCLHTGTSIVWLNFNETTRFEINSYIVRAKGIAYFTALIKL